MKLLLLSFALFISTSSFAQIKSIKLFVKEVGWTINFPKGFYFDSAFTNQMEKDGIKAVEETNNVKADLTKTKTLFSVVRDKWNNINSTITPFDSARQDNYKTYRQQANVYLYKTYLEGIPDSKVDSSNSTVIIAGLTFDSFHLTVFKKGKLLFDTYLLSKFYKNYDFTISYLYLDDHTKQDFDRMLRNSRFQK